MCLWEVLGISVCRKGDYLDGKPTFINFWFTRCPPCIEELPLLNKLKAKYGDKVNFISITFDDKKKVDDFLKKHKFDYMHITDSEKQIDALNISGFPTNMILDKDGVIRTLNGAVNEFQIKQIETVLDVLSL
ncbi:TlpA family protein disulfide reductase [Flavobacterium sp. PLA-1-15]|uniref:TlpA family protein disulfide reductase n=1 Tax=Flavobacterium sp. PLA-1-15 TaxID=3380533 RepID=UPI003B77AE02